VAAEIERGAPMGFFGRHACRDVFLGELVNVEAKLGVICSSDARLGKRDFHQDMTDSYSTVCRMLTTAPASRFQFDSSLASCLRPFADNL